MCRPYIFRTINTSFGEQIKDLNPALYKLSVGEVDLETDIKWLDVERVVPLDFKGSTPENDIGLLKLKKPLSFNDKVRL